MSVGTRAVPAPVSTVPAAAAVRGGDLAAVLVVALASVLSLATVAGWLGWTVLRGRAGALGVLATAAVVGVAVVWSARPPATRAGGVRALALALPALSVLAATVVGAVRGAPRGIEWFLNGDHPRHVVYVADTWVQGNLSYAVEGYPRGWHSALAAVWSVAGAGLDAAHVARLLELTAAASLLLSAVLALALAHLGHALATRVGLPGDASVGVGVVVGALSLLNVYLANYQALGYQNSVLGAVVMAVCCREVLVRAGTTVSLVVCASGVVVVAHSWQLLLPPVGVAALWCAVVALRSADRTARRAVAALVPLSLVLGAPGVLAVVAGVGLDHASEAGPDSPVPVVVLVAGLLAAVVVAVLRRDPRTTCVAVITVLPALTAVGLAVGLGLDLLHYYPSKLLWQTALLALPWLAVLVALAVAAALRRRPTAAPVARGAVAVLAGLVTAYALLLPWGSQAGAWSTVDGSRVLAALTTPGAPGAVVVWLEDSPTTDSITRSFLDVLRVEQSRTRAPQARTSVEQECALLRAAERPVVLSTAAEAAVRDRYSCVPDVVVVPVALGR